MGALQNTAGGHGKGCGGLTHPLLLFAQGHMGSLCPEVGPSPNPPNEIKDEGEVAEQ